MLNKDLQVVVLVVEVKHLSRDVPLFALEDGILKTRIAKDQPKAGALLEKLVWSFARRRARPVRLIYQTKTRTPHSIPLISSATLVFRAYRSKHRSLHFI